jgi:hypothetical protein
MTLELFDFGQDPLWNVLIRFFVTLFVLFIVIRGIYYRYSGNQDYSFTFFLMGIMMFLVCILLKTVEIQMGIALGLFAIFAILRFRTENIGVKNAAYFFTVIGISVINSMANFINPVRGTILINLIIILAVYLLEIYHRKAALIKHLVIYEHLEMLKPERESDLLRDLSLRTGRNIVKIKIRKIDFNKENAELNVFFRE